MSNDKRRARIAADEARKVGESRADKRWAAEMGGMGPHPDTTSPLRRDAVRFGKIEFWSFIFASVLTLATSQAWDVLSLCVGLGASFAVIVIICVIHEGKRCFRILSALVAAIVLTTYGYRIHNHQLLEQVHHDYVDGTTTERAELRTQFPFGYVVVRQSVDMETWQPNPLNHIEWRIDWDKTTINPDFATRTVSWQIINPSATKLRNGKKVGSLNSDNVAFLQTVPLIVGDYYPVRAVSLGANEPQIFVGTISDNQRIPVFVLGFRLDVAPAP